MDYDYYFKVKNNLCQEPKHEEKLGDAVWLYLYLLSWANTTGGEKTTFYLNTYSKRLIKDKELVRSQLKLLVLHYLLKLSEVLQPEMLIPLLKEQLTRL